MKNLQSTLLGRFVTLTDDKANESFVIVAIWLGDSSGIPCVALESINQFGKSVGGRLLTVHLGQLSMR